MIISASIAPTCYLFFCNTLWAPPDCQTRDFQTLSSCCGTQRSTPIRTISMAQTSNRRLFKPKPPVPSDLLYYDHIREISRIPQGHRTPIAVCIAGACRGIGTPPAKGAMGVWFGEDGRYNTNCSIEFLPHWACKSIDGAAIFAAQLAVETVKENFEQEACADRFVIITDSYYLLKAFSRIGTEIDNWVDKRFRSDIETAHDDIMT